MAFLVVFLVMVLVVGMMAVGVMIGRKPIAGSCGGIANLGIEKECSICGGRSEEHTSELQSQSNLVCRLLLEKKKSTRLTPPSSCYHVTTTPVSCLAFLH